MSESNIKPKRIIINIERRTLKILLILNGIIFLGSFFLGLLIGNMYKDYDNVSPVTEKTISSVVPTQPVIKEQSPKTSPAQSAPKPESVKPPVQETAQIQSRQTTPSPVAKEEVSEKTTTISSNRGQRKYTIQVISLRDYNEAINNRDNLRRFGLDARIMEKKLSTGTWYRVRIGSFNSEREAYNEAKKLEEKGIISSFWVSLEEN